MNCYILIWNEFRGVNWFVSALVKGRKEGREKIKKEGLEHQTLPLSVFESNVIMLRCFVRIVVSGISKLSLCQRVKWLIRYFRMNGKLLFETSPTTHQTSLIELSIVRNFARDFPVPPFLKLLVPCFSICYASYKKSVLSRNSLCYFHVYEGRCAVCDVVVTLWHCVLGLM